MGIRNVAHMTTVLPRSNNCAASAQVKLCLFSHKGYLPKSGPDSAFSSVDLPACIAVVSSSCNHTQEA